MGHAGIVVHVNDFGTANGQNKGMMSGKGITRKTREFLTVVMFQSPPTASPAIEQTPRFSLALLNETD